MPAQTRGFLFSDLRGYSAYTELHGDRAARALLVRYRRVVRDAIPTFGGAEIRTEGDSFYVVFDSVSQAVEAGLAIQLGLLGETDGEPIRAGIGIHAGDVEDDLEHGIVSSAVNIAARICAQAEPGEVLVSETVRLLTRSYLEVRFIPRGRRKLKGIGEPVPVYRVLSGQAAVEVRGRRRLGAAAAAVVILAVAGAAVVIRLPGRDGQAGVSDGSRQATAAQSTATASASTPGSHGAAAGVTTITLGRDETFGFLEPAIELAEGTYTFADFRPRVTFSVDDPGWYASADFVDAVMLELDNPMPAPGLDPIAHLVLGSIQVVFDDPCNLSDTRVLDATPHAVIAWLQGNELLTTSRIEPVNMGGYSGLETTVSLAASGCRGASRVDLFPVGESRYFMPVDTQVRVIVLDVPARPLTFLFEDVDDPRIDNLLPSFEIDPP